MRYCSHHRFNFYRDSARRHIQKRRRKSSFCVFVFLLLKALHIIFIDFYNLVGGKSVDYGSFTLSQCHRIPFPNDRIDMKWIISDIINGISEVFLLFGGCHGDLKRFLI